ncbi:alpha/beta hydrolase [Loktanella sp. F6476L]|uniref:alpha/beta fold hydrolase n=1 Tax=Loktanella sp. F6476L TaxID=2926405 RepID=UPI001FF39757|nr:alpha/beta hydrolase [Loktanella sp. F6476L]MCK0119412.1 alpha/beta hydrolase [Loktanella sp. F6476L]
MIHFYHGLIGDHRHFAQVVARLENGVGRCHAPDIPFLDQDYSDAVEDLRDTGLRPTVRVGNSIGCALAVALAGDDDQLILTAPPFDYSRGMVPLRKAFVRQWIKGLYVQHGAIKGEAALLQHAMAQVHGLLESRAQIKRLRQYKSAAQSFWGDPRLVDLQDRITFVIGDADDTTPTARFLQTVKRRLPRAKVEVWANCGHAVPLDAPDRLAALIRHRSIGLPGRQSQPFALSA